MVLEFQDFFKIGPMERSVSKYSKPGNVFQLYVFITSPYFHQKWGRETLVTPRNPLINFSNNKLEAFARFLKHRPSAENLVSMSHQNWLLQFHSILSEITVSSVLTLSSRLWFFKPKGFIPLALHLNRNFKTQEKCFT